MNYNSLEIQRGKLGREFRLSCIFKVGKEKWVRGKLKTEWCHLFRYVDDGTFFALRFDLNGKLVEKIKDMDLIVNMALSAL